MNITLHHDAAFINACKPDVYHHACLPVTVGKVRLVEPASCSWACDSVKIQGSIFVRRFLLMNPQEITNQRTEERQYTAAMKTTKKTAWRRIAM
jgi:hypothetical protein